MIAARAWSRLNLDAGPLRWLGGAMMGLGVLLPHLPGDPGLPCPLRSATGVPCPFCGLTTSVKTALHGDVAGAAGANPFGLVLIVVSAAVLIRPSVKRVAVPAWLAAAGVAASWLFELHRFGFW